MTRPKHCRTCHAPDCKNAVEETRPYTHITIDAQVKRGTLTKITYYCDEHIAQGMLA